MEVPQLITDLAIMLMTAAFVTLIFRKLKLSLILGYIVAGFIISPYFPMFLNVESLNSITTWSEIGVVIILFHIGLEFDLHKIANMGSTAVVSALVKMMGVMAAGYGLGVILGFSTMNSIFLGAMLSISSTVVIQKCFEERGLQGQKFSSLVMGSLVMEDVFGVFIMVILSTISVSQSASGEDVMVKLSLMACYLVIWLLLGIYIVPTFLNKAIDGLTDETFTVLSIGFCFMMGLIAHGLGFSIELGAFLAGSLLAGTKEAHRIEKLTLGIKDLFGAIFFLSVGMKVDPQVIVQEWTSILPIAIVAVIAKLIFAMIGVLLSGQDLETAVKAGTSLAPIGEFSFIIAMLGINLSVMDAYLYPVIVSASILTIIFTPLLIGQSDRLVNFIYRVLPDKLIERLDDYTSDDQGDEEKNQDWRITINAFLRTTLLYGVIMFVAAVVGVKLIEPMLTEYFSERTAVAITCIMIYAVIALFARPMLDFRSVNFTHLWLEKMSNRPPLLALVATKLIVVIAIVNIPIRAFFNTGFALMLLGALAAIYVLGRTDIIQSHYLEIETRFLRNLNEKTLSQEEAEFGKKRWLDEDYSIFSYFIPEDADYVGKTIEELAWGKRLSVYIVKMRRGTKNIVLPRADTVLHAGDKLYIVADESSLQTFHKTLNIGELENLRTLKTFMETDYADVESALSCAAIKMRGNEKCIGKPIKESKILEKNRCMVLGIQRDGYAINLPDAYMKIQKDDILWVLGLNNNIGKFAAHSLGDRGSHKDKQVRPAKKSK